MDIDKLISDVMKRESTFESIVRERREQLAENASLNLAINKLTVSEKRLIEENSRLKVMLENLEESFIRKYDYKEECCKLRHKIARIEADSANTVKLLEKKMQEAQEKFQTEEKTYKSEARRAQEELQAEQRRYQAAKQSEIEDILSKSQNERLKLEEKLREKDAEIFQHKIEHDAKMRRMQDHLVKVQNNAASSHSGNEIFRKKLQHDREASAKKIAELETRISQLQRELAEKNKPRSLGFIEGYSRHIASTSHGSASKKKKSG